jgi:hypothetical protein
MNMEKRRSPRSPVNSPAIVRVLSGVDIGLEQAVVIGNVRRAGVDGETEQFPLHGSLHPALA